MPTRRDEDVPQDLPGRTEAADVSILPVREGPQPPEVIQLAHDLGGCAAAVEVGATALGVFLGNEPLGYAKTEIYRCSACPPSTVLWTNALEVTIDDFARHDTFKP